MDFSVLFERCPVCLLVVDDQGWIRYANAVARRWLSPDPMSTHDPFALTHFFSATAPDVMSLLEPGSGSMRARLTALDRASKPVWLSAAAAHVDDDGRRLICVSVEDLQAFDASVAKMRVAEKALQNTAEAVMVLDADGAIVSVNAAYAHLTGLSAEAAIGTRPVLRQHDTSDDCLGSLFERVRARNAWEGELWSERRDGARFPALVRLSHIASPEGHGEHYALAMRDLSSRKQYEDRIDYLAFHDALTGLANRDCVQKIARSELAHESGYAAVLMIDVDGFSMLNGSLGQAAGDELLQQMGNRLSQAVSNLDTVGRYGNDEFVVLATRLFHPSDVVSAVNKLVQAMRSPFWVSGQMVFATACIGASCFPEDGRSFETLLNNARTALGRARAAGHDSQRYYVADMNPDAHRVFKIRNHLHQALEHREFRLHFQPVVDLASGRIIGMEALIRWQNAELGLVSPGEFIPVAEESGMIVAIGDWVLREACRGLAELHEAGFDHLRIAVNLSARQFLRSTLADDIAEVLDDAGLSGRFLEVEITETMLMTNTASVARTLEALADMGVTVALDDFGTGYSSLEYLKRFPIHYLKIDKSFVDGIPDREHDVTITRTIIGMARSLGLRVTGEGVETVIQRDKLREWNCEEVQGYYFSMPLASDELRWLLDARDCLPFDRNHGA